jgi:FixJ family two-component response regulator
MLSGHGEPDIVEWARDEGVTDYIIKPVTAELLYERIIAAIAKPLHIIETATYRGPSPRRRLVVHAANIQSIKR